MLSCLSSLSPRSCQRGMASASASFLRWMEDFCGDLVTHVGNEQIRVTITSDVTISAVIVFFMKNETVRGIWLWDDKHWGLTREGSGYTWSAGEDAAQIEEALEKFSQGEVFSVRVRVEAEMESWEMEFCGGMMCANLRLVPSSYVTGHDFYPQLEACGVRGWREFVSPRHRKKARTCSTTWELVDEPLANWIES